MCTACQPPSAAARAHRDVVGWDAVVAQPHDAVHHQGVGLGIFLQHTSRGGREGRSQKRGQLHGCRRPRTTCSAAQQAAATPAAPSYRLRLQTTEPQLTSIDRKATGGKPGKRNLPLLRTRPQASHSMAFTSAGGAGNIARVRPTKTTQLQPGVAAPPQSEGCNAER